MRTKILLFLILVSFGGWLRAQDTIRSLIISEARLDEAHGTYFELTNMGDSTLHLRNFEVGIVHPWNSRIDATDIMKWFNVDAQGHFMLPDWTLDPGKTIVIAGVYDYNPKMWLKDQDHFNQAITKPEMWKLANIQIHFAEAAVQPNPLDSVTPYNDVMGSWQGRALWYVRHHVAPGDSVVVDQVGGVFTNGGQQAWGGKDVAGVTKATETCILVRKFTVKQGNVDFNTGRGTTASESEWIAVPVLVQNANPDNGGWEPNRAVFWTVGNHVNQTLSPSTLVPKSSALLVNYSDSTITVPWGVRDDDSIMYQFVRAPGFGWHYDYVKSHEDSAYVSIRTGDILTVYACGDVGQVIPFTLKVSAPTADANIVVPKKVPDTHLTYVNAGAFCEVTDGVPGMDTIRGNILYGITFATRVDTLLKYLEKPSNASWKIVFVDGMTRTDLKNGDILEVTAENGTSVKDYFIKVRGYKPSHNAELASITWPDIPDTYRGYYGWQGDTISGFLPSKFNYQVVVPFDVDGIPGLFAKNSDINATLVVDRAKNLTGTVDDRTVTFTSTAPDMVKVDVYKVELSKGKDISNVQPWKGEPFISQYCFRQDYSNDFIEIVNPGTDPLDLSHYMLTFSDVANPADAITGNADATQAAWADRYVKYIPGMRWQDSTAWKVTPAIAITDVSGIQPIVLPGDVFVIADKRSVGGTAADYLIPQIDLDFANNPWGEVIGQNFGMDQGWALSRKTILFKILNDTVYNGKKPATDPNDFKVIDMFGYHNGSSNNWVIGGINGDQVTNWTRKPYIYKGNPLISTGVFPGGSFGTDEANSEWIMVNETRLSLPPYSYGWPATRVQVADGIGSHFMNTVTVYKSTVSSLVYKETPGYTNESLWGVITGTTVADFKNNILKADTAQRLNLKSHADGSLLADAAVLVSNDTLSVLSADSMNVTKYVLTVTPGGLSKNDTLTSATYTVVVDGANSNVSGFEYGTLLKDVVAGIDKPAGCTFNIINGSNAYQPMMVLNYDTMYVDVQVSSDIYFEVIAENGVDKIVYQLKPTASPSAAFVTSDVYNVSQETLLIDLIPTNTTVFGLFRYLTPAPGATIKLIDKLGFERTEGFIVKDDKLVVTSQDGTATKTYYLGILTPSPLHLYYLAYVLSTAYNVDQTNLIVDGNFTLTNSTLVSDFLADLTPAPNASVMVVNGQGVENTGTVAIGDKVQVTAGDGLTTVVYSITNIFDAVNKIKNGSISMYPNPTSGNFTLSGIAAGSKIVVSNILGQHIFEKIANSDLVSLSLAGQTSGIYFIQVTNDSKVVGSYKLILK